MAKIHKDKITDLVQDCFNETVDADNIKKIMDLYISLPYDKKYNDIFDESTSVEVIFACELIKQYLEFIIASKLTNKKAITEDELVDFCDAFDEAVVSVAPQIACEIENQKKNSNNERRFS